MFHELNKALDKLLTRDRQAGRDRKPSADAALAIARQEVHDVVYTLIVDEAPLAWKLVVSKPSCPTGCCGRDYGHAVLVAGTKNDALQLWHTNAEYDAWRVERIEAVEGVLFFAER